jgi:hypothetical protein
MNVTPIRTVRIPEDLWLAAQAKAKSEGKDLSSVIRRLLRTYARS